MKGFDVFSKAFQKEKKGMNLNVAKLRKWDVSSKHFQNWLYNTGQLLAH